MTPPIPRQVSSVDGTIFGAIDGANRTYVLLCGAVLTDDFYWNGVRLTAGRDYTRSGNTVTLSSAIVVPPSDTDILTAEVWTS